MKPNIFRMMILGVVGLFWTAGIAFAQFKMGNTQDLIKSASSTYTPEGVSISDLGAHTDQAIADYLGSTRELVFALREAAEAFGIKSEVSEKLAVMGALTRDNINSNDLENARRSSEDAQAIIVQKMGETPALNIEDKALLADSITHLTVIIQKNGVLIETLKNLSSQTQAAQAAPVADMMVTQKIEDTSITVIILTTAVPLDLKTEKNILGDYAAYANANGIPTPDNVPDLLKQKY